jgi:predicted DNA-binding protein (UPF0251 family)
MNGDESVRSLLWRAEVLKNADTARRQWHLDRLLQAYSPAAMELVYRIGAAEPLTEEEAEAFIARRPEGFRPSDWADFVRDACRAAEADPREEYSLEELLANNAEFIEANPDLVRTGEDRDAEIARLAEEEREQYDRDFTRNKALAWQQGVVSYIARYLAPVAPPITGEEADSLTDRQFQAVAMLCHRRLTPEEAGEQLGVNPTTVQRHLEEAAKSLGLTTKELRRRTLG